MADIICRVCGEPWDSTGGLHHSHSDLTWWQYKQLIHGMGCPCCGGEYPEHTDTEARNDIFDRWESSIVNLAEDDIDPVRDLLFNPPKWCFNGVWADGNEAPCHPALLRPRRLR